MTNDPDALTIRHVQEHQPWTVPYSDRFQRATYETPWNLGTHVALHVMKTAGKIAAVFEALDHGAGKNLNPEMTDAQREMVANMSADLLTAALRFANLYGFDLAERLGQRVLETNGVTWPAINDFDEAAAVETGMDRRP